VVIGNNTNHEVGFSPPRFFVFFRLWHHAIFLSPMHDFYLPTNFYPSTLARSPQDYNQSIHYNNTHPSATTE
jgi:hypothetical protein